MGNIIARLFSKTEARLLLLGLDAAGKTTILYKLRLNEQISTIPTIGFNVESVEYKNLKFTMWDVGGQERIRSLWRYYFEGTNGLIFVVDVNDRDRISEAGEELHKLLHEDQLADAPILLLCNKIDLPMSLPVSEVVEKMGMNQLRRKWHAQATCARSGEGLFEGLDWLARQISSKQ